jgi:ATP-binding cassette subfamily F protein 3
MPLLTVANLHHAYGTHVILDGATLSLEPGEKVGMVGRNGGGKTTLMRIILGQLKADAGSISMQRGARAGYLSQDPSLDLNDTVRDAVEGAFEELHRLHQQLHTVYDEMAGAEGEALDRLLRKQAELEDKINAAGGYTIDHKIDAMLHGLGFEDAQFNLKVRALSGGQKGRLGLAKLLLQAPDLLLLDEPTNHLDLAGRQWLEEFLAEEYPGAVLMVSHDRWLLDRVVHRIIEVEQGVVREYPGNYHDYVALRQERRMTQARVFEKQQDKIRSEEQFIARYKAGQRARQAQGRLARLERFKRDEVIDVLPDLDVMHLTLPKGERSGDQVIVAEGISKRYGARTLFEDLDITITRGERIGIIGPNGTGKTTLVKCLLGDVAIDSGRVRTGSRLNVGYYRQLHDHLDQSLRVWQYLQSVIVGLDGAAKASEQQARDLAGAFLFSGLDQEKPLSMLSGGERSRAVIAGLVAGGHNVLVLDEPTNHLDIPSAERLERAVSPEGGFEGTLILISHDRALLEATCERLIVFDGHGGVQQFPGRYSAWAARQKAQAAGAGAARPSEPVRKPAAPKPPATRKERAANPAARSKLSFAKLEESIEALQREIAQIDESLLQPATYADGEKMRDLQRRRRMIEEKLTPLETEWARRAEDA